MKKIIGTVAISVSITVLVIDLILKKLHPTLPDITYHLTEVFCFVALILGVLPFIKAKFFHEKSDLQSAFPYISTLSVVCLLASYYVIRYDRELLTGLSILVSSAFISAGWFTQAILQKISQRRQHTVNTLMKSRHSEVYQNKLDLFSININSGSYISEALAKNFVSLAKEETIDVTTIEVIRSGLYIANYFEYLAIGIRKNDLENDLLFESWAGVLANIERKLFYLLVHLRKKDDELFEHFVWLCNKWNGKDSLLYKFYKNESSVTNEMLGKCAFNSVVKKESVVKESSKKK